MALIDPAAAAPTTPVASSTSAAEARRAVRDVALPLAGVVAILYFGREFFIPLALAILLSFLLAPLIRRLEHLKLGRVTAVIIVTLFAFALIGGLASLVGAQLIDLANKLPDYKQNLVDKVHAFQPAQGSALTKAKDTLQEVTQEFTKQEQKEFPKQPGESEKIGQQVPVASDEAPGTRLLKLNQPVPVSVVETPQNALDNIREIVGPIMGPLGTAALVIVFVVFMLLERQDLRDRVIHLIGRGHLRLTTQALNEAGRRVSRYLLAQLIVNVTYGLPVGIGLAIIGIPNAALWGVLATVLRFVPYIGPWIAAAFPTVLSLAVSTSWATPLQVIGLIVALELFSNNVVEPWLYGSSTGMSPVAIIVSAAFWTWLWGAVGLLLATPLTVCMVVMGKYIPSLAFLDVLLGEKPPIAPEDRFYQRLLAMDEEEVCEIAEDYTAKHSLQQAFDNLIVPAMRLADEDFKRGMLSENKRASLYDIARDLVTDLSESAPAPREPAKDTAPDVVCVSASDYADELVAMMLARLLAAHEITTQVIPSSLLASETIGAVVVSGTNIVAISALPPNSTRHAIYMAKRLREPLPHARILVGVWGEIGPDDRRLQRISKARVEGVFTSLQKMVNDIVATVQVLPSSAPVPAPNELPVPETPLPSTPPESAPVPK